jgi:hypothetical protein
MLFAYIRISYLEKNHSAIKEKTHQVLNLMGCFIWLFSLYLFNYVAYDIEFALSEQIQYYLYLLFYLLQH